MSCGMKDGKIHLHTPIKAIRHKCLDCAGDSSKEVELCPVKDCALYPYRFGKRPGPKRQVSEEQKERLRQMGFNRRAGVPTE
jgi:hypothetical protein